MPIRFVDYLEAAGNFSLLRSSSDFADGVVATAAIADGAVTGAKLNADDIDEMARDALATALIGGTDISITPDDDANTITIAFTGTGQGSSRTDAQVQELARDAVGTALRAATATGRRVTISVDDNADTITLGLTGTIAVRDLPETLQILETEYQAGGRRLLTDGSIQIGGDLQGSALGIIDTNITWGAEVDRTQDTSLGANPWIQMRFRISDYAALPTASILNDDQIFVATDASGDPDVPTPTATIMTVSSRAAPTDDTSGLYHYAYVQLAIANWPAGDYIRLLHHEDSQWNFRIRPGQIVGGVDGQIIKRVSGVWMAADDTARSLNGALSELTWTGDTTVPQPSAANTEGEWGDLQTLALAAGDNLIWFDLLENRVPAAQVRAWIVVDFQIRRTRSSVTTTAWEIEDYIVNPRAFAGGHAIAFRFAAAIEDAEAGDTYTLRARYRTDNTGNIGVMTFDAADQRVHVLNMATAGTGQQLLRDSGNELHPGTVGIPQMTDVARARFDPEFSINFLSGLGEHLWRFGSPAQGDAVENNNPNSSYEPLDPGAQTLPVPYDRRDQTLHTDFLGYVFSFANDPERISDPRFGRGGIVDNALPMAPPSFLTDESIFLFTKYVPRGSGGEPIHSIWTDATGATSWTLWHNATNGRVHVAEADGTEYGDYTIPAGGGLAGRLVSVGFQADKTATGWQFALQVNGHDVPMSNPSTNPAPTRVVYGHFESTRFNGQMMVIEAIKATNAALGIPAGATGGGNTGQISPFGVNVSQYVAASGDFEYGRAWSQNLLDSPAVIVNSNRPYITFNQSFDMDERDELRLEVQLYASERAYVHQYLRELATSTLAVPNTAYVDAAGFEWESGKSPTQWWRGQLSNRSAAQYGTNFYPVVNGRICTGLQFRNHSNGGDTLTVRGVWVR